MRYYQITTGLVLSLLAGPVFAVTHTFCVTQPAQPLGGGDRIAFEVEFTYDEATAPSAITESGAGPTNVLQELIVKAFRPDGPLWSESHNIVAGVSSYQDLIFNYDTTAGLINPPIDFYAGKGTTTPGSGVDDLEFILFWVRLF